VRFTILIPVKAPNAFLTECLRKCCALDHPDFEIIVLPDASPDASFEASDPRIKVIPTGSCLPAKKRDMGADQATGDVLAFLDDDAYPAGDWLSKAEAVFQDITIGAVGGPAITPPQEESMREASGLVYASWVMSGRYRYRYAVEGPRRDVDDLPSCNLMVRKDVFKKAGGFRTDFWPGEDTLLCLEIISAQKRRIVYDPEVLVFHHRRKLFWEHFHQIANYALHRGHFVKRFPSNSRRWPYFIPSAWVFWTFVGVVTGWPYIVSWLVYIGCVFAAAFNRKDPLMTVMVFYGIIFSHFVYGINFIEGLLRDRLKEEKGEAR
jgi:GT2 family glycosyltransferase